MGRREEQHAPPSDEVLVVARVSLLARVADIIGNAKGKLKEVQEAVMVVVGINCNSEGNPNSSNSEGVLAFYTRAAAYCRRWDRCVKIGQGGQAKGQAALEPET